ncbi:ABC transporter substrate-binding protein [Saliniramus fredricksonii]|uniref:Peptide/nickel transport system substrate-binding protein n=3 Tax=Saliniramus fredricksonii TaxID=1653334 RepID=A0ABY0KC51_9HYPH|nr:ABC transporter substrate-binding protein [Saliniramus fredricksonii]SCC82079.1 peptide/nickel transport system substrate-binding protein [Saliniramus fredricksonii]
MKTRFSTLALAAALPLTMMAAAPALSDDLRIGLSSEPSSMDPHFHNLGPNNALRQHIFQSLTYSDENMQIRPSLATAWEATTDTTWEFTLRDDVSFSNGDAFSAEDVIYSICRVPMVEGSPSSFTSFVRDIVGVEVDGSTITFTTDGPSPLLPTNMSSVAILNASVYGGEGVEFSADGCANMGDLPASTDFSSPETAIGTGPYTLENFVPGDRIELTRNADYWDGTPSWDNVTLRPIANPGARVAALLAGDVDVIETPPIQDFDTIREAGFQIDQGLSNRVIYLHMDSGEEVPPGVSGTDGVNPFADVRVREAISKAINRDAIVERVMGGVAVPAGELLPYPLFGTREDAEPDVYDPERSAELLEEAGFGDGFEITLSSPNDRYINAERVAQAVAQFLSRIGIRTGVDAMTASTFFSSRNNQEFGMWLAGWGAASGEMANSLTALVATRDPDTGMGSTNRQRYSNPAIDALVMEARRTVDDDAREEILQRASIMAMEDYATVPLHFEVTPWAFAEGLELTPRVDQYTIAMMVRPAE